MRLGYPSSEYMLLKQSVSIRDYLNGPLAPFLVGSPALEVGLDEVASAPQPLTPLPGQGYRTVFAAYRLQDISNYRRALQQWFNAVEVGGHLIVISPHTFLYERQNALPSRWNPAQRRLYTPGSLMLEIEEALTPNSYRVRYLGDVDGGYDYALATSSYPVGRHEVAAVIEKIVAPLWSLSGHVADRPVVKRPPPENAFEPAHTRVETAETLRPDRILILKLDHLGDFIMATPALEKARASFPEAEITLVVGSWNHAMALALGLFDHVIVFDGFPRNAGEEKDDIRGTVSAFEKQITGEYDVAIDLRADTDTRVLLESVRARVRAGLGTKVRFPFLDIFLPIDVTRHDVEQAWETELETHKFSAHPLCWRNHFEILSRSIEPAPKDFTIIWGPYERLSPGRYRFEPFSEVDLSKPGIIRCDVALDTRQVAEHTFASGHTPALEFTNTVDGAEFEFRYFTIANETAPTFRFYGGRLMKQGASGVLHQSEYLSLLVELVAMRVTRYGLLKDHRATE